MTNWGNPPNMGICVVCFLSNSTLCQGGLIRAAMFQELQPIIIGVVLGAFISALGFREFRARGGASPIIRFLLGVFVAVGALVFIGCPTRMMLRIAGGDLNGLTGLGGLVLGVLVGVFFLKGGFSLGSAPSIKPVVGRVGPFAMMGLLIIGVLNPGLRILAIGGEPNSTFAPLAVSLGLQGERGAGSKS